MSTTLEADALIETAVEFIREWAIPGTEQAMARGIMDVIAKASVMTLKAVELRLQAALGPAWGEANRDGGKS